MRGELLELREPDRHHRPRQRGRRLLAWCCTPD